jgi:putative membrane protein
MVPAMFVGILISWVVLAVTFAVTSWLLSGMDVSGGVGGYLWVSLLFGLVNTFIGTIVKILTLPLTVLTLGLFSILVNAFLLWITDSISDHLTIDDFWWTTIWAAIIISIVSMVFYAIVGGLGRRATS